MPASNSQRPGWARVALAFARGVVGNSVRHDLTTAAAGVAFFALLAVFPGLAAVVSIAGTFAEPDAVEGLLDAVRGFVPRDSAAFLDRQIERLVASQETDEGRRALTIASVVGFAVLLWGANRGTRALVRALDEIHGGDTQRGLFGLVLRTLAFTVAGILVLVFAVAVVVLLPLLSSVLPGNHARAVDLLRWPVLLALVAGPLAVFFRFAPNRRSCSWRAIAWGSGVASLLWIGGSILFSWYVTRFGGLSEIYGPLSAAVGYMVWSWLSVVAVLIGAEVDAAVGAALAERADIVASPPPDGPGSAS